MCGSRLASTRLQCSVCDQGLAREPDEAPTGESEQTLGHTGRSLPPVDAAAPVKSSRVECSEPEGSTTVAAVTTASPGCCESWRLESDGLRRAYVRALLYAMGVTRSAADAPLESPSCVSCETCGARSHVTVLVVDERIAPGVLHEIADLPFVLCLELHDLAHGLEMKTRQEIVWVVHNAAIGLTVHSAKQFVGRLRGALTAVDGATLQPAITIVAAPMPVYETQSPFQFPQFGLDETSRDVWQAIEDARSRRRSAGL
ncbi:hypothetical protein P43SY_011432 [Pythium insidiosum]|uniref:Uncharacterized protein n=1 Tax=Pythium insidiosum TaxID=114742 RepID=A0AAD5Q0X4_PYTIN|nr:hypothetical protein P43SY_011432 [Pythium insidiosum]